MARRRLDLRGVQCPINLVKAKLVLEEMEDGETLEILLDSGKPAENVPKSLKRDGYEILQMEDMGNSHRLVVRKR